MDRETRRTPAPEAATIPSSSAEASASAPARSRPRWGLPCGRGAACTVLLVLAGLTACGDAPEEVVVQFSAEPLAGPAPLTVQFTDESSGDDIIEWEWKFGDGTKSSKQNPAHVYSAPGSYTVRLKVSWFEGAFSVESRSLTKPDYIQVFVTSPIPSTTEEGDDEVSGIGGLTAAAEPGPVAGKPGTRRRIVRTGPEVGPVRRPSPAPSDDTEISGTAWWLRQEWSCRCESGRCERIELPVQTIDVEGPDELVSLAACELAAHPWPILERRVHGSAGPGAFLLCRQWLLEAGPCSLRLTLGAWCRRHRAEDAARCLGHVEPRGIDLFQRDSPPPD